MKNKSSPNKPIDFGIGFKYPFNRMKGLLNILWILIPIFGFFAVIGYGIRIVQDFTKGKFEKLPFFDFSKDMKFGFFMLLKAIPFLAIYLVVISLISLTGYWPTMIVRGVLELFVIPILSINFYNKMTVGSYFEFGVVASVFNNLIEYIVVVLKSILLAIIFLVMSVILIGIPAAFFTQYIFLADFYKRYVK